MTQRWSLRTRFVVFATVALLPLLIVVVYILDQSTDNSKTQLRSAETAVASIVGQVLSGSLQDNETVLDTLATDDAVRQLNPAAATDLLATYRLARPGLTGFFLIDATGKVVATAGPNPAPLQGSFSDALEQALSAGQAAVSHRFAVSSADNVGVVAIIVPVWAQDKTKGQPIGALGALLSVDRLKNQVLPFAQGATTIAVVRSDQVIANQADTGLDATNLTKKYAPQIASALDGVIGSVDTTDDNGNPLLTVYAPVPFPDAKWAVLVTNPAPTAFDPSRTLLERGITALAVAVLLTLVLAVLLGEWTARPLRALTTQAEALAKGDFTTRLDPAGGGEVGALAAAFQEMGHQLATQVSDLEAAHLARQEQAEQLRDLHRRTVRLQEDERRRIAGEIHDAVSPLITGALYQARALQLGAGADSSQASDDGLQAVTDLLEHATKELHGVIFDLRPPDLDELGVVAAIERYVEQVRRTGLNCRFEIHGEPQPQTSAVRLGIYRIVQEALHNIVRHAEADEAVVRLESAPELLRVTIHDNGVGFDPERAAGPTSLGLLSMRERAAAIGATLTVTSHPGGGTALIIERWATSDVKPPAEPASAPAASSAPDTAAEPDAAPKLPNVAPAALSKVSSS